jgi:hypothetical protein
MATVLMYLTEPEAGGETVSLARNSAHPPCVVCHIVLPIRRQLSSGQAQCCYRAAVCQLCLVMAQLQSMGCRQQVTPIATTTTCMPALQPPRARQGVLHVPCLTCVYSCCVW